MSSTDLEWITLKKIFKAGSAIVKKEENKTDFMRVRNVFRLIHG